MIRERFASLVAVLVGALAILYGWVAGPPEDLRERQRVYRVDCLRCGSGMVGGGGYWGCWCVPGWGKDPAGERATPPGLTLLDVYGWPK